MNKIQGFGDNPHGALRVAPLWRIRPENDDVHHWNGRVYLPFHSVSIACGPFLSTSTDSIEQHLGLPPESEFRFIVRDYYEDGVRKLQPGLSAARVCGDSMIDRDIRDGDPIILQRWEFDYVENGKIMVIERLGEEEGMGAWSLKKLVIKQPGSSRRDPFG